MTVVTSTTTATQQEKSSCTQAKQAPSAFDTYLQNYIDDVSPALKPGEPLGKAHLFGVEQFGKTLYVGDIAYATEKASERMDEVIRAYMKENGIPATPPVELGVATDGKVIVTNEHPDKEKIEALFADHPEIRNEFTCIAGNKAFLAAADRHQEFAAEYAINPMRAVMKYSHLFDTSVRYLHRMTIAETESFWLEKETHNFAAEPEAEITADSPA